MTDGLWIWNPDFEQLPFDVDQARSGLAAAGWTDSDADGVLDRAGSSLTFELLVPSSSIPRQRASVIVQPQQASPCPSLSGWRDAVSISACVETQVSGPTVVPTSFATYAMR